MPPTKPLAVGDRVELRVLRDIPYVPGTVQAIEGNQIAILWDDGFTTHIPLSHWEILLERKVTH